MSTVLLVEDDDNTRERLARIIEATEGLSLFGAVATVAEARALLEKGAPDVLLTDLGLPDGNGIELIRRVRQGDRRSEAMVISVFGDERHVIAALEAGAAGYILKDGTTEHIGKSLLQLVAGGSPVSAPIARHLLKRLHPEPDAASASREEPILSDREVDVLTAVAKGFTYNEIAEMLSISFHTVSSHVKHIYRKLEVRSRSEAVYEAVNLGLIRMDD